MNQHLERLDGLAHFLKLPALTLIERCEAKLKRKLLVVSGWRSMQEQLLHYQNGRTFNRDAGLWEVTGTIVTRAVPGTSPHNVITRQGEAASMALDVIPFFDDGSLDWEPGEPFWEQLWEIAWKCGLDPLGDSIGAQLKGDDGHFEEPNWKMKIEGLGMLLPVMPGGLV